MVPALPFYRRPDLPPWFAVIGAAAVGAAFDPRMRLSLTTHCGRIQA